MINRILENTVANALSRQPAVVLLGPRQVGKTTLAFQLATLLRSLKSQKSKNIESIYLDLELPEDLQRLSDPLLYLRQNEDKLVILDEIQRVPELFPILRGLIDERRRQRKPSGHFLLLGSASLDLMRQSSETLAGRVAQYELTPLIALEIENYTDREQDKLWIRGGFPNSYLEETDAYSFAWRQDFIRTYLERGIPQLGSRIPAETMRRFWTMLAHNQSSILNAAIFAENLGVSQQSIARYVDLLVDLLLVRRLQPYHSNVGKRLVKSPKFYIRDTGILHALLGIDSLNSLMGHTIVGASFEAFVIENCLNVAPPFTNAYFYRTAAGAEIDLLLEFTNGDIWAIEIKKSLSPKLEKGFFFACDDVKPTKKFVIYPGKESYPITSDCTVMGLREFLQILQMRNNG